jgi:hypothetical protein
MDLKLLPATHFTSFLLLVLSCCFPARAQIYQGFLGIPRLDHRPEIDGSFGAGEWDGAVLHTDFTVWTLDQYVPEKTEVRIGYDDQHLYLLFIGYFLDRELFEDFIEEHKPVDSHMWGRTHFGVALSGKGVSILLKCGPTLSRMDFRNGDLSWNGSWDFEATVQDDHWTGEFCIPFSDLGLEKAPTAGEWRLSLEHCNPSGESSHWNGRIEFVGNKDLYAEFKPWPRPVPRRNRLGVRLHNRGPAPIKAGCEISLIPFSGYPEFPGQTGQGNSLGMILGMHGQPLISETFITIDQAQVVDRFIEYDLPAEGNYYASVNCRDEKGHLIRQIQGYWFTLTPNRQRLIDIRKKLGEGISILSDGPDEGRGSLMGRAGGISSAIDALLQAVPAYTETLPWDSLTSRVDSLEKETSRFLHMAKLFSAGLYHPGNTFGIAAAHSINKFGRDEAFPGQVTSLISLSGARNEYESFQLVILPLEGVLNGVEVKASDFCSTDGNMIPKTHVEFSLVDYNLINWQANYVNQRKGWHPDPLIPVEGPFRLSGGDLCRPLWITIYVPEDAKPGRYTGQITVSANGREQHPAQVEFRVWDFQLPAESHLKTHTWDDIGVFEDFYGVKPLPVEWYMNFCDVLLKNRLNPSFAGTHYVNRTPVGGRYDFTTVEKVLQHTISQGMNRFTILQMKKGVYQPGQLEAELQFLGAYTRFLQKKGWLAKALVEIWDEPTVLQWEQVRRRAEQIREISPDIRIQLFAGGSDPYLFWEPSVSAKYGLLDLIDIWAPNLLVNAPDLQEKGKEIWTYFCTLARSNAPNFYIDAPPIYQRTIPWYCWMHGVDGFEHWSTTYFWRNVHKELPPDQKWPLIPWDSRTYHDYHGEGQLVYPGPQGRIYPSMRLEIFRDGMEDYEYLFKLRELLDSKVVTGDNEALLHQAEALLKVGEYMLVRYPHDIQVTLENTIRYPDRPALILETREKIAQAIESLQNEP